MSDFDPYLQWLGIRDPERPVNYYRLLGLDLFEADQQIISMAADRQMEHVRSFQNGPHGRQCNDLLSELAIARRRLLTAEQKQEYDDQLRSSNDSPPSLSTESQVIKPDTNLRRKQAQREQRAVTWGLIGWVTGAIAAVGVGGYIVTSGVIPGIGVSKQIPDIDHANGTSIAAIDPAENSDNNATNQSSSQASTSVGPSIDNGNVVTNSNPPSTSGGANKFPLFKGPGDFRKHRQPSSTAVKLIGRVKGAIESEKFEYFGQSNDPTIGNRDYREIAAGGGLLIGIIGSQFQNGDLKSLQPVFLKPNGAMVGVEIGVPLNRHLILAQPGFAVGSLEVAGSNPIQGIRVTFMKIGNEGLDVKDSYTSAWFGNPDVATTQFMNPSGWPIIGIQGRLVIRSNVCTTGLIGVSDVSVLPLANGKPPTMTAPEPVNNPGGLNSNPAGTSPANSSVAPTTEPPANVASTPPVPAKLPEPNAKDIGLEMTKFRTAYRSKIEAAKTPELKTRLAGELFMDGRMSTDPLERFVILSQACELGIAIGDADLALTPLRELNDQFEIDFLELAKKTMVGSVRNAASGTEAAYKQVLDELIQEMLNQREFDGAGWFAKHGRELAKQAGQTDVFKTYQKLEKNISQMEQLSKANTKAEKLLLSTPDDQAAHQTRGDYLFAMSKDLKGAVSHWAKSDELPWQQIAALEIEFAAAATPNAELLAKLTAAWNALGARNSSPRDTACLNRAAELKQTLNTTAPK